MLNRVKRHVRFRRKMRSILAKLRSDQAKVKGPSNVSGGRSDGYGDTNDINEPQYFARRIQQARNIPDYAEADVLRKRANSYGYIVTHNADKTTTVL